MIDTYQGAQLQDDLDARWSEKSVFSIQTNSLISDDEKQEEVEPAPKKRGKGGRGAAAEEESKTENTVPLSKRILEDFNNAMHAEDAISTDPNQFAV